jgi:putative Ig domain-containing protein
MTITVEGNPPEGMEGDSYYTELTAAGGTPPYTWEYDTPLPDGLSLMPLPGNQRVAIQGVPSGAGSTQCTIIVTDSAGDTGFLKFTLKINQQLAISTRGLPSGIEGKPYKAKLKAKGGGKSYTWTASGAPDGLRIDANTGEIAGTPAAADTPFTIRVADSAGHTAEGNFTIRLRSTGWQDLRAKLHDLRAKFRNWRSELKAELQARGDIVSSVIILVLIAVCGIVFAWLLTPPIVPSGAQPPTPKDKCASTGQSSGRAAAQPLKVSDASGSTATLNLFIGRGGGDQTRQSAPLTIQKGKICPGGTLAASIGDLVRSDGQILPTNQVTAWGRVDSTGTHVTIWVHVNPRYGHVSGFGSYSGIASLVDSHALGANVPVDVHVLYPDINLVLIFGFVAAFGGFTWAWLVHDLRKDPKAQTPGSDPNQFFWRNFILRIAVLLAATIPVVNAQVLANPDWTGELTQYITLATLAGAAALALTPTFRALALPPNLRR